MSNLYSILNYNIGIIYYTAKGCVILRLFHYIMLLFIISFITFCDSVNRYYTNDSYCIACTQNCLGCLLNPVLIRNVIKIRVVICNFQQFYY
jgi:hypothetical protein